MATVDNDPEVILNTYKEMSTHCQAIASKISELKTENDEHRLVIDLLKDLEPERKAFRLIGGVLVERTVGDVGPIVSSNRDGVSALNFSLKNFFYCCVFAVDPKTYGNPTNYSKHQR